MHTAIDMRIFKNINALGLLNAMLGYRYVNPGIIYLVNKSWMFDFLRLHQVPDEQIVSISGLRDLINLRKLTIILPMQRPRMDIIFLYFLGCIRVKTFVHDLHFLSRRPLLAIEFADPTFFIKRLIYLLAIRFSDEIFVDSNLVRRQVMKVFNRNSTLVILIRYFLSNDVSSVRVHEDVSFDYFIPLGSLRYKGIWALDRLLFDDPFSRILVDSSKAEEVHRLVSARNPHVVIIHRDLRSETALSSAFRDARATLCLSRHEGFGFAPYEAAFFGSIPVVLNCSAYLEVPRGVFVKLPLGKIIPVPMSSNLASNMAFQVLAKRHVLLV
jgi:hypothetical protein